MRRVMALGVLAAAMFAAPHAQAEVALAEVFTEVFADLPTVEPTKAVALEQAEFRAEAKPTELAPPYLSATGALVVPTTSAATSTATAYAAAAIAVNPDQPDDGSDVEVPVGEAPDKVTETATATAATEETTEAEPAVVFPRYFYPSRPTVKYSLSDLTAVQEEILTADIPDGHLMYAAAIDAEKNRVVVSAGSATDALRAGLAARYGADKVAIGLTPGTDSVSDEARHNDTSPFYGGARTHTSGCTTGFAWTHEGVRYTITAGHCTSLNAYFHMPVPNDPVGTVVKDTWNNSKGTVKLSGQSYYAGDVSIVKHINGFSASPRIYTGGPRSSTSRAVAGIASRAARRGDKYCTGGATTGVVCNWQVSSTGLTVEYNGGTVARNVVRGNKTGTCTHPGDSGGPVYTMRSSDGKVIAKGIHSGGGGGGSDHYGGIGDPCREFFTDIRLAEKALPGIVLKS